MTNLPSIALVGKQGAGKDEVSKILASNFGYTRLAFADALRAIVGAVYDLNLYRLKYDSEYKNTPHPNLNGKTPRFALQHIGTEGFRAISADTWLKVIERKALHNKPFVISDLRFQNEDAWCRQNNVLIVAVVRDGQEEPLTELTDHSSEMFVPSLINEAIEKHHVIRNDGTLLDLKDQVVHFITDLATRVDIS